MSGVETAFVCLDVQGERAAQDAQWGEQNHPDVDQVLLTRPGGASPARFAEEYGIPTATRARQDCDFAARRNRVTWAHIAVEELAEAIEAAALGNEAHLCQELIQLAAVAVAWVEAIDRRSA